MTITDEPITPFKHAITSDCHGKLCDILRYVAEDPDTLAHTLLGRYFTLPRIVNASRIDLSELLNDEQIDWLGTLKTFFLSYTDTVAFSRDKLSDYQSAITFCKTHLTGHIHEKVLVLFLDRKNKLIKYRLEDGDVDRAPVYPRKVIYDALQCGAAAIIVAHNHPSGDPTPSTADITVTNRIVEAAKLFNIVVHDHYIIGDTNTASFKQLGLL